MIALFLISCGRSKIPAHIIAKDRMTDLLVDIHLVDGSVYMTSHPDSVNKYALGLYKAVFAKHKVDTADFRKSFIYYSEHPIEMDKMYDDVLKKLQVRQDSALEKNRLTDSVRAARAGDSIRRKLKIDSAREMKMRTDSQKIKKPLLKKPGKKNSV
ncbi:MAG: DUF4296 domain-containing protein [Mucilaginibacter polytrichastri]|nr:DUF4296 domain-containing protein [Mucilaginibacter polytrichastri]